LCESFLPQQTGIMRDGVVCRVAGCLERVVGLIIVIHVLIAATVSAIACWVVVVRVGGRVGTALSLC